MDDDTHVWVDSVEIEWRKRDDEPALIPQLAYENSKRGDEAED
jgi:hypothetical protein